MKDTEPIRQNGLSDPSLIADCRKRSAQARLDLTDLEREGQTKDDLDTFDLDVDAFEKLPDDDDTLYARQTAREKRDAVLEAARSVVRDVRNPIRRAYGETSAQVKRLGAGRLADASPAEVMAILADLPDVGATYLDDENVLKHGFSQARLDALPGAYTALKTAQGTFLTADQTRLEATRTRVLAYNDLDTRVAEICARGYDHYVEKNEVKARAYVRDPAPGPSSGGAAPAAPTA